jgi:outer membrane receptor protein involved in Fe transport
MGMTGRRVTLGYTSPEGGANVLKRVLFWGAIVLSPWAQAEEDLFDFSLEQLAQVIVTGATLSAQNLQEVPSSVTVFSAAQIRQLAVSTLEELMNYVPGFQAQRYADDAASDTYSARGRRTGSSTREVLILLNGMRLHTPYTDGPAFTGLDLHTVKQIEFIRGPGSAIYGSNAFLGVVNITTDYVDSNLSAGLGNHRQQQLSWGDNTYHGNFKLGLFLSESSTDGDDYQHVESFGQDVGATQEPEVKHTLEFKAQNKGLSANVFYMDRTVQNGYEIENVANRFNVMAQQSLASQLHYEWSPAADWHMHSQLVYLGYARTFTAQLNAPGSLAALSVPSSTEPPIVDARMDAHSVSFALRAAYTEKLQLGLDVSRDITEFDARANYDFTALAAGQIPIDYSAERDIYVSLVPASVRHRVGVFWQQQLHVAAATELFFGLRYDFYDDVGEHASPRLAVVRQIGDVDTLKFSYGEAFRAPAQNEQHMMNNVTQQGNADLKPEIVQTYEGIWTHMLNAGVFELSYFENRFVDGIEQTLIAGNIRKFQNTAADEKNRGIEVSLLTPLSHGFSLRLAGSHFFNMAESSFRESQEFFSGALTYNHGRWEGSLAGFYRGDKQFLNRQGTPTDIEPYWLLDSKIQHNFTSRLQVFAQIRNLFDRDYYAAPAGANLNSPIPNPGRNLLMGLSWQY